MPERQSQDLTAGEGGAGWEPYKGPLGAVPPGIGSVRVDWKPTYTMPPRIILNLDRPCPAPSELTYEQRGGVFLGVHPDGWRYLYVHSGGEQNEGGFYGSSFRCPMSDGSVRVLAGPWSGSSASAFHAGFEPIEAVCLTGPSGNIGGFYLSRPDLAATLRRYRPDLVLLVLQGKGGFSTLEPAYPNWGAPKGIAQERARREGREASNVDDWNVKQRP